MQIDPTRTKMLREQYASQLVGRYRLFGKKTFPILIDVILNYQKRIQKELRNMAINQDINKWLEVSIENIINEPSKEIISKNVTDAYHKGAKKANKELTRNEVLTPGEKLTVGDYEVIILLQENNYNRIKDCSNSMKDAITYSCTKGVMNGWGSEHIAAELNRNLEGNSNMGMVRARMIARTEIVTAYNTGAEQRYKMSGLTREDMIWITAFDERTCDECAGNDEKTVEEIGELPPVHPNCRCSIAPK